MASSEIKHANQVKNEHDVRTPFVEDVNGGPDGQDRYEEQAKMKHGEHHGRVEEDGRKLACRGELVEGDELRVGAEEQNKCEEEAEAGNKRVHGDQTEHTVGPVVRVLAVGGLCGRHF